MATVTLDARHAGIPSDDRSAFALFEAWLVVVATLCGNGAVPSLGGEWFPAAGQSSEH